MCAFHCVSEFCSTICPGRGDEAMKLPAPWVCVRCAPSHAVCPPCRAQPHARPNAEDLFAARLRPPEPPRTCMFEKLTRKQCRTPQFAQEDAVSLNPLLAGGFAPKPIFVAALVQRRAQSKQVLSTDSSTPLFVPLPHAHASLTLPIAARAADAGAARVGAASHDACV